MTVSWTFYLGTGFPTYDALAPNIAYRNNDGKSFTDVTFSAGLGHLHKGHGIAFGDLDRDGDQDIFAQIGGFFPGDRFQNALLRETRATATTGSPHDLSAQTRIARPSALASGWSWKWKTAPIAPYTPT